MQTGEGNKKTDTFPSQELPCSGSTGLISALGRSLSTPGKKPAGFHAAKITGKNRILL